MMDTHLWLGDEILNATQGRCGDTDWLASGVAIDSRAVINGDLFVAIVGPTNDGHDYLVQAFENGAVAALVSHTPEETPDGARLIHVPDTLKAMEALGMAARARCSAKVIAVTGSVGKTGTKEALAHILTQQGKTHYSVGSFNNHWGVPLSLSRMPRDTQFAVFELGMNHAGELGPLSKMVQPDVAIITTVAAAHLEFFKDTTDIALAKAEIFEGVVEGGLALINADNEHCALLSQKAKEAGNIRIATFGEKQGSDIQLVSAELKPNSSTISAQLFGEKIEFDLPVPGRHWVQNILAVLGAVHAVGANIAAALDAVQDLAAPKGRGVVLTLFCESGPYLLVDESYNASPVAMQAAFSVLARMTPTGEGKRVAVLGDMRELGAASPQIHANLAIDVSGNGVDVVYACGPNMKHLFEALPKRLKAVYATSSVDLVAPLLEAVQAGDIVLIKGSLGSNMKLVLDALQARSDELKPQDEVGV